MKAPTLCPRPPAPRDNRSRMALALDALHAMGRDMRDPFGLSEVAPFESDYADILPRGDMRGGF